MLPEGVGAGRRVRYTGIAMAAVASSGSDIAMARSMFAGIPFFLFSFLATKSFVSDIL